MSCQAGTVRRGRCQAVRGDFRRAAFPHGDTGHPGPGEGGKQDEEGEETAGCGAVRGRFRGLSAVLVPVVLSGLLHVRG